MGEMLEEIPPHHEIAETAQVPKLKTKLGCAISQAVAPAHSLSKQERDFNFPCATPVCYTSATPTSAAPSQQHTHSTDGSSSERMCQLLRFFYPSVYDWQSNRTDVPSEALFPPQVQASKLQGGLL